MTQPRKLTLFLTPEQVAHALSEYVLEHHERELQQAFGKNRGKATIEFRRQELDSIGIYEILITEVTDDKGK